MGCAMPEAEQGMNVARIASLRAGVPHSASAVTVNRFCASGLEAIACAVDRVRGGSADVVLAGGTESMSLVPMGGHKISPNPGLVASYPDVYLTTGLVAENHAREHGISREAQDAYAYESHRRAIAAQDAGRFDDEIVPVHDDAAVGRRAATALATEQVTISTDEGPRRDTSIEALARLRPAFHVQGHGHGRQRVADERWRGRRRGDERGAGARARRAAAGQARGLRDGRRRTGALRHRTGAGGPQGTGASGPHAWPTST